MSPIIGARGGLSARAYGLFSTAAVSVVGDFESIATVSVSSSQSSISFSSIPSTYKHLQLRLSLKDDRALNRDAIQVKFNGDGALNYTEHQMYGEGSGTPVAQSGNSTSIQVFRASGNSGASSIFGVVIADILDYQNTNKYKTLRFLGGIDLNGSGETWFGSGSWASTSAINAIALTPANASNYLQYSHAALYGIKG
jgi:hypothetical protein